jgi:hypothetical protein
MGRERRQEQESVQEGGRKEESGLSFAPPRNPIRFEFENGENSRPE